jgi:hypothetical protein
VQVVAHVPELDARLRMLRGNIPSHRLSGCGCVGPTMTSGLLRGVYVTYGPLEFGPCAC